MKRLPQNNFRRRKIHYLRLIYLKRTVTVDATVNSAKEYFGWLLREEEEQEEEEV